MNGIKIIANTNGLPRIKEKLHEECLEVIEAIKSGDEVNLVEEIADVLVVILQYAYKSEQSRQIKTNMRYKIARTLDKIEKGELI